MNRRVDRDPNPSQDGPYVFGRSVSNSPFKAVAVSRSDRNVAAGPVRIASAVTVDDSGCPFACGPAFRCPFGTAAVECRFGNSEQLEFMAVGRMTFGRHSEASSGCGGQSVAEQAFRLACARFGMHR